MNEVYQNVIDYLLYNNVIILSIIKEKTCNLVLIDLCLMKKSKIPTFSPYVTMILCSRVLKNPNFAMKKNVKKAITEILEIALWRRTFDPSKMVFYSTGNILCPILWFYSFLKSCISPHLTIWGNWSLNAKSKTLNNLVTQQDKCHQWSLRPDPHSRQ